MVKVHHAYESVTETERKVELKRILLLQIITQCRKSSQRTLKTWKNLEEMEKKILDVIWPAKFKASRYK